MLGAQALQSDGEGIGASFARCRRRISFAPGTMPAGSPDVGSRTGRERTSARLTAAGHLIYPMRLVAVADMSWYRIEEICP